MYDVPDGAATPVSDDNLQAVVAALDQIASVLPAGHELFTAVYDLRGRASDVVLREASGATSARLGLARPERAQLTAMLSHLRESMDGSAPTPAPSPPAEPSRRPEPPQPPEAPGLDTETTTVRQLYGARAEPDFRAIVEQCPIPLIVMTADGAVEYASPATVHTLGIDDPAQMEGLFMAQFVDAADRERFTRATALAINRLDRTTVTVRLRGVDGSQLRAELAVRALPGRGGLILAVQEPEISRNGIEEALVSERRQRALAGAADSGVALIDATTESLGAVVDINREFGRLTDGTPGELVGTAVWDLVQAGDIQRVRQAVQQVSEGGGPRRLEVTLSGGSAPRVSLTVALDRSSGDPPALATVLVRDVTEQQGRLGELNRTIARLEHENRQLAEFARVTAHDLMAPLRALSDLVAMLEPDGGEDADEALAAVRSAVARMLAMVDSAVAYAGSHVMELSRSSVDLNRVTGYALETLAGDISASHAEVSVGDLPFVTGDPAQLERLMVSLISNAINYAGELAPRIEIHAVPDGAMWRVSVADEGIGVTPAERESIFRLFERGVDGPVRAGAGRGIGLATCRQIVELHGGRIWVEPGLPRGSTFIFTLPGN